MFFNKYIYAILDIKLYAQLYPAIAHDMTILPNEVGYERNQFYIVLETLCLVEEVTKDR